ncbi:hypothetical protein ABT025_13320 [Streptomyces sp. NPDC002809]|uniref:hypothetical protein n=1 Tax=Streptomyces sp. NPDC002809 TaxID=3154433 RepID=UPI00332E1A56
MSSRRTPCPYRPSVQVLHDGDRLLAQLPVGEGQERDALRLARGAASPGCREPGMPAASLPGGVPFTAGAGPVAATAPGYRPRRARERFGVDLDDSDTRLLITLAVHLSG